MYSTRVIEQLTITTFFSQITLEDLLRTYRSMLHSCTKTGCIGFNVNTSNTLAAVFTATGQDIGAVCESSSAYFFMEPATAEEIRMHSEQNTHVYNRTVLLLLL